MASAVSRRGRVWKKDGAWHWECRWTCPAESRHGLRSRESAAAEFNAHAHSHDSFGFRLGNS